jgi:hypothetical protein
MVWTFEEINSDWLGGSPIAIAREKALAAFERCERRLGRGWIEAQRGSAQGALRVIRMGERLASLEGVGGVDTDTLIEGLRNGDRSASSELHALHLLRRDAATEAELYPPAQVGKAWRRPDMRVRLAEPWVYVEVTRTNESEAYLDAQSVVAGLVATVESIEHPFTLEVFLRRQVGEADIYPIRTRVEAFCAARATAGDMPLEGIPPRETFLLLRAGEPGDVVELAREELPNDAGVLILTQGRPGDVVMRNHPGEQYEPRLLMARRVTPPDRHIIVRMPFLDERAARIMGEEARQLPKEFPGLLMIDVGEAPGAFRGWEPLIRRRFQPLINTRVSGVCLFSSGVLLTADGAACPSETKLLINQHAKIPLPPWIADALAAAGAEYERVLGPEQTDRPRAFSVHEMDFKEF